MIDPSSGPALTYRCASVDGCVASTPDPDQSSGCSPCRSLLVFGGVLPERPFFLALRPGRENRFLLCRLPFELQRLLLASSARGAAEGMQPGALSCSCVPAAHSTGSHLSLCGAYQSACPDTLRAGAARARYTEDLAPASGRLASRDRFSTPRPGSLAPDTASLAKRLAFILEPIEVPVLYGRSRQSDTRRNVEMKKDFQV